MNYSIVIYIVGWVMNFQAVFLALPCIVSLIYKESEGWSYLIIAILSLMLGTLCTLRKPKNNKMFAREGFVIVALSWLLMSIVGAIPFVMTGDIPNYIDALFETISGFTTTGASVLTNVEALSYTSLFWRSFTHWIGGMGVFVFIMAVLPLLGNTNMNLMRAESPGPNVDKLVPRVKDTAVILYAIYIAFTVVEILLLWFNGMPLFDAFTTTFGTVGTGGFGIKNDSMASYSPTIQVIVTVFMILSGVNYGFFFLLLRKKLKQALSFEEVRWYFIIIAVAIAIISFNIYDYFGNIGETIRVASFQVGSIITTTGYATYDFNLWPQLSKTVLIMLMFVGACASSTGGGIKVSRIVILFKTIKKEMQLIIHPRGVKKIAMDKHSVSHEVVRSTNVFIMVYFSILFLSVLLIGADNLDFTTNFTAVAATLNNIGPGMQLVGPTQNYSVFSTFPKLVLMFDMLAGRLEFFPMLILFSPSTWRKP